MKIYFVTNPRRLTRYGRWLLKTRLIDVKINIFGGYSVVEKGSQKDFLTDNDKGKDFVYSGCWLGSYHPIGGVSTRLFISTDNHVMIALHTLRQISGISRYVQSVNCMNVVAPVSQVTARSTINDMAKVTVNTCDKDWRMTAIRKWLGLPLVEMSLDINIFDDIEFNPTTNPGFLHSYAMIGDRRQHMAGDFARKKGACFGSAVKLAKKIFKSVIDGDCEGMRVPFLLGGREKMNEFEIMDFWNNDNASIKSRPIMMEDFSVTLIGSVILQQFNSSWLVCKHTSKI